MGGKKRGNIGLKERNKEEEEDLPPPPKSLLEEEEEELGDLSFDSEGDENEGEEGEELDGEEEEEDLSFEGDESDEFEDEEEEKDGEEEPEFEEEEEEEEEQGEGEFEGEEETEGFDREANEGFFQRYNADGSTWFPEDSSEEEPDWDKVGGNRVGNIPMEFYKDYDHIGYDITGKRILRSENGEQKDQIDKFLDKEDNADFKRMVWDNVNQKEVKLSKEDYDLVKMLVKGKTPIAMNSDDYWLDSVPSKESIHPITNIQPRKAAFIPSKHETARIKKLIKLMESGKISLEKKKEEEKDPMKDLYLLWGDDGKVVGNEHIRRGKLLPKERTRPPRHQASYNPPGEFLFTEREKERWIKNPEERKLPYIPTKYNSLRDVPSYRRGFKEQFGRMLQLYQGNRLTKRKKKVRMTLEELLPQLPKPEELRPFPTIQNIVYEGHTGRIRSISVDPTGQWIVSGADDSTVRIWEVATGRCVKFHNFEKQIFVVAWCPNPNRHLVAIAAEELVYIMNPGVGSEELTLETDNEIKRWWKVKGDFETSEDTDSIKGNFGWHFPKMVERKKGVRTILSTSASIQQISWHSRGDYLITVSPKASKKSDILTVHQLSKKRTQRPFKKPKGLIQCAQFHPTRPELYVATQQFIKIYSLETMKQENKLSSKMKWISSFDIHPRGENLIVSSYDRAVCWFDLDLSKRPYKTMKYHRFACRRVQFHKNYPLFASCSDDGTVQVFHGMAYDELDKDALIVPLKILRGHTVDDDLGVMDLVWHPIQPWLISAGVDGTIRLWT